MAETHESEIEELVRRAIRATYTPTRLEQVSYIDAIYEGHEDGTHRLRVRAPDHDLLGYERWVSVTFDRHRVAFRGAGPSGQNEFFVLVRIVDA